MNGTTIELWTDGSQFKGKTSWAYRIMRNEILIKNDAQLFSCNHVIEAEMMAIIQGLKNIPESINNSPIVVKSDNKTIIDHMRTHRYFRNCNKIDPQIVAEFLSISRKYNIRWVHIYSHSGTINNNRVDSATRKVILKGGQINE